MLYSYHVHSTYSDGKNSILEMIQAAANLGLDEVGLSDHLALPTEGPIDWSMQVSDIPSYFDELRSAASAVGDDLTVRFGIEVDFDPRTVEELPDILQAYPFDYVIGSIHYVDGFLIDECAENWYPLTESDRNDVMRAYWRCVAQMAGTELFDFVAHLELYKKFGHRPTIDLSRDISNALDAIARAGLPIEINTAGWFWPSKEAYPSEVILRECKQRGIPVLVSSDAHVRENLTRGFEEADELVRSVGYTDTVAFAGRETRTVPARSKP